jgi:hypothetical protein
MTVSVIVTSPKSREYENFYIPVATEDVYKRVWLKGAQELGAYWLPMFESGIEVSANDFEEVSRELVQLRNWVLTPSSFPLDAVEKEKIVERIDLLLEGLKTLGSRAHEQLVIFIG